MYRAHRKLTPLGNVAAAKLRLYVRSAISCPSALFGPRSNPLAASYMGKIAVFSILRIAMRGGTFQTPPESTHHICCRGGAEDRFQSLRQLDRRRVRKPDACSHIKGYPGGRPDLSNLRGRGPCERRKRDGVGAGLPRQCNKPRKRPDHGNQSRPQSNTMSAFHPSR